MTASIFTFLVPAGGPVMGLALLVLVGLEDLEERSGGQGRCLDVEHWAKCNGFLGGLGTVRTSSGDAGTALKVVSDLASLRGGCGATELVDGLGKGRMRQSGEVAGVCMRGDVGDSVRLILYGGNDGGQGKSVPDAARYAAGMEYLLKNTSVHFSQLQ